MIRTKSKKRDADYVSGGRCSPVKNADKKIAIELREDEIDLAEQLSQLALKMEDKEPEIPESGLVTKMANKMLIQIMEKLEKGGN